MSMISVLWCSIKSFHFLIHAIQHSLDYHSMFLLPQAMFICFDEEWTLSLLLATMMTLSISGKSSPHVYIHLSMFMIIEWFKLWSMPDAVKDYSNVIWHAVNLLSLSRIISLNILFKLIIYSITNQPNHNDESTYQLIPSLDWFFLLFLHWCSRLHWHHTLTIHSR